MGIANHADIVRKGYAAFNAGDGNTLAELFAENADWHTPGRGPLAGDHVGRDAVFAYFGRLVGETQGTFRATLEQVFQADDGRVVGLHRNVGERNGKRLDVSCCIVFTFEDDRVVDGREHYEDMHAWDDFWS